MMFSLSFHLSGPHWHDSYKKDRRLPLNADCSGESTSNDSGDHRQRPRPRPHRAHLLAVHKWGTRTQTQVSTTDSITSFTECLFLCNKLCHSTVRMWTPTASTLLRMMARSTLTSLHWTLMSQSISLVSALWPWWRNTPHLALLPDSRCLSECKYACNYQ